MIIENVKGEKMKYKDKLWKLIDENGILIVPEGIKYINALAFENCKKLKKVIFPNSLVSIGMFAFSFCTNLKEVILNEGLKKIDMEAFENCIKLKEIIIPKSVTIIKENPFIGCKNLKSIIVNKDNSFYDSRDDSNAIIKTKINKLISGCSKTKIPSSVTILGEDSFSYMNIKSIKIPSSIKK